jgi:hypothetical protein
MSTANVLPEAIAIDGAGDLVVVGHFEGTIDFGEGNVTANARDLFVLAMSRDGDFRWARGIGGTSNDEARSVATDLDGNLVIAGDYSGSADFGGGLRDSAGLEDVFVLGLDTEGGYLWDRTYGGTGSDRAEAVTVAPSGDVVIAGEYEGNPTFDGEVVPTALGGQAVFVLKVDRTAP